MEAILNTTMLMLLAATGQGPTNREAPLVTVICRADAQIRGTAVLLGDLAEIKTSDPRLTDRLLALPFGRRPAPGFNRVLSRHDILLALVEKGLPSASIKISGAGEIVLHPLTTLLPPQEILEKAEPVLRAILEREPGEIEFEPASKLRPQRVPPGRRTLDLRARLHNGRIGLTSAQVDLSILVDGEEFKVLRLRFRLHRFLHLLVATRAIAKGTPFDGQNLALQRSESHGTTSIYLSSFDAVAGKVAAQNIQAGQKITLGALTLPAVIRRGDPVSLVAASGRVRITTRAMARQDGAVGDHIVVTNMSTGKVLRAIVLGAGVVSVRSLR